MTSAPYTSTAAATKTRLKTPKAGAPILNALKSVRHFLAVCIGVYAEQDSNYRGLDLYGKPIWVKPQAH